MSKIEELLERFCPTGVKMTQVGEIAKILNGYAFKSGRYTASGIRVVRISDVQKGKISDKDLKFYPLESEKEIKNYFLHENDLVMSLTGNVGRVAMLSKKDIPAGLNQRVACIRPKSNEVKTRFLFYLFDQNKFEDEAMTNATGGGQKNMSTTWLAKYEIPIPPLPIQEEIVRILDKFTRLDAELDAELEARMRQYEFYRKKLLSYEYEQVEWRKIGDVGEIKRGVAFTKKQAIEGRYPVIANASNPITYHNEANRSGECIVIARSGANAGLVSYWNEELFLTDAFSIHPNNTFLNTKFTYYYLKNLQRELHLMKKGSGVPHVRASDFEIYYLPVPSLEEQEHIVKILDKFDILVNDISVGLPAEIKARREQYEFYRGKLLTF